MGKYNNNILKKERKTLCVGYIFDVTHFRVKKPYKINLI